MRSSLQSVITEVRRFRADQGLKPGQRVPARLTLEGSPLAAHEVRPIRQLLRLQPEGESFTATASLPVAGVEVASTSPVSSTSWPRSGKRPPAKDLAAAEKEKAQANAKLGNEAFLAKAPDHVVDKIRGRAWPRRSRTSPASPPRLEKLPEA